MERKDFRPENSSSSSMSDKDRKIIQKEHNKVGDTRHVIKRFVDGKEGNTSNNSLHTDGKKLYSYNTVIATKQSDGTVVVNNTRYSNTTSKQQSRLRSVLAQENVKYDVTGGKSYGYEGEDFSAEIKDEKAGAEHYEKLAKENPEHKDTLNRMASNERQHAKKLKEIEKESKKEKY